MAEKTIQIADKETLDLVKTILQNGTYGNSALNTDLDSIISKLDNGTFGLNALKTVGNNIYNMVNNGTYGLSAIKTAVAAIGGGSYQNMQRYVATTVVTDTDTAISNPTYVYSGVIANLHTYNRTRALNSISITGKGRVLCEMACPAGTQSYSEWTAGYGNLAGLSHLPTSIETYIDGYQVNTAFVNLFLKAGGILEFNKGFTVLLKGGTGNLTNQKVTLHNTPNMRAAKSTTYTHFACYILM